MHEPRYICLHQVLPPPPGEKAARGKVSYVLDSWYCYREVATFKGPGVEGPLRKSLRAQAEALAAEWNAEHDAEMAAA